jgi:hypothetical protein
MKTTSIAPAAALGLVLGFPSILFAQATPVPQGPSGRMTPLEREEMGQNIHEFQGAPDHQHEARMKEMFPKFRAAMLKVQEARVRVAQDGLKCVKNASEPAQLRACREKEKQAMHAVYEKLRSEFPGTTHNEHHPHGPKP